MSGNQRIFNFTAVDNGVSTFYDKVNAKAKEFSNLAGSASVGAASNQKNQLNSLKEYIATLQKAMELEKKRKEQSDFAYIAASQASRYTTGSQTPQPLPDYLRNLGGKKKVEIDDIGGGGNNGGGSEDKIPGGRGRQPLPVIIKNWDKMPNYGNNSNSNNSEVSNGNNNKSQGTQSSTIIGSILAADAIKAVGRWALNTGRALGSATATAQNEDAYLGTFMGAIPGVGGALGPAYQRMSEGQQAREQARLNSLAVTGNGGVGAMTQFGMTTAESSALSIQIAKAGGSSRNLRGRTEDLLGLQYGFGLDQGTLLQQEQQSKLTGGNAGNNVASLIATLQEKGIIKGGDFSQLEDLIKVQNSFIQAQSQNLNNPNASMATGIVTAFKNAGFETPRLDQIIGQVNKSITNPQNDFAKAENFAALATLPSLQGGSFLDFQKAQEKGLEQEGMLGAILKQQKQRYGGGDSQVIAASQRLGISANDAQLLINSFNADETSFEGKGKSAILSQVLGKQQGKLGTEEGASTGVSKYGQQRAQLEEDFADSAIKGIVSAFKLAGPKLVEEVSDAVVLMGEKIAESISGTKMNWSEYDTDKSEKDQTGVKRNKKSFGVGGGW